MENIKCIFCNTESTNILIHENGYSGKKCSTCQLIYISPRPSLKDIIDLYGHDHSHATAESHIKFSYGKKLYSKHTLKIIKKYIKRGNLLEIGAGAGYFLDEARMQGFNVYGIELNSLQADFIRTKHDILCEEVALNENSFKEKIFDIIYHCDVISHFYDPIKEFKNINIKLKENGYVVFETGNLGDVDPKYFKYITNFQYPDHLFFFSEKNIITLLENTGFELVKSYNYSIIPQLYLNKVLKKITYYLKPNVNSLELPSKKNSIKYFIFTFYSKLFYFVRNNLKKFYVYIFYLIRYKFGNLVIKKSRPQTIIIVARKKFEVY